MYIQETTAAERGTVRALVDDIFITIERAQEVIATIIEDYFDDAEQRPLSKVDAKTVRELLRIAEDILFNAVLEYCLTVGRTNFRGVKPHMDSMDRVYKVFVCEDMSNKLLGKIHASGNDIAEKLKEMNEALKLPDVQAIFALQKMLDREEAADDRRGRTVY